MRKIEKFMQGVRECLGTPFHHQGRMIGVGMDCAGTVVIPAKLAGYDIEDKSNYAHQPDGSFRQAVEKHCDLIDLEDIEVGDLLMFKFDKEAQHIGVISNIEPLMMIHAWAQLRKVTENSVDKYWLGKIDGCYRMRG